MEDRKPQAFQALLKMVALLYREGSNTADAVSATAPASTGALSTRTFYGATVR